MTKRRSVDIRRKKSRSHKTKKRLEAKAAMLAAKGVRRNSVGNKKPRR